MYEILHRISPFSQTVKAHYRMWMFIKSQPDLKESSFNCIKIVNQLNSFIESMTCLVMSMEILTALGTAMDSRSSVSIPCACQEEQGCTRCSRGNPSACAAPAPLPRGTGACANGYICVWHFKCSLCLFCFCFVFFVFLKKAYNP